MKRKYVGCLELRPHMELFSLSIEMCWVQTINDSHANTITEF